MLTLALIVVAVLVLVALLVAGGALDRTRPARRVVVERPVTRERIVETPVVERVRERVVERPVVTERVIEE